MKSKQVIPVIMAVCLLLVSYRSFAQTAEELLPKAIQLEEVKGDLDEAIKTYLIIVNDYPGERKIVAEAYYHLGMCYEKLGRQDARKAYQTVINNYGDQKDVVVLVRKRLSNLEHPITKAEESKGLKIRQVWKAPYLDALGTVTYDGRLRSCVDWGDGDVAVQDLATGEIRKLTDKASLGDSSGFALETTISGNGKLIASAWWKPYNTTDLVLTDLDDPRMNVIYSKQGEVVYPYKWLSDNEIVGLRVIPDRRTIQIITFNITNNTLQVKKAFNKIFVPHLACSPDGQYIAYDCISDADKGNIGINLLMADGDDDITLINHPSNNRVLGWVPGRKEFLFLSDRSGSWDLWAIKLDGTKTAGQPERIYSDIGEVEPLGFTSDGKCYFGFVRRNFYSGLAPFSTKTGEIDLGSAQSLESQNWGITWSPDGQYLAYVQIESNSNGNPMKLFVQDLKTGKRYQPDNNMIWISSYSWSPDGNFILVRGREMSKMQEEGYKGGVFMVDVKKRSVDPILLLSDYEYNGPEDDSDPLSWLEWAPDGKSFYFLFQKDRLMKYNLETGEDKIVYKYPDFMPYILEVSPDGKNLLLGLGYPGGEKSRLVTIPAEGGKEQTVCTAREARSISWARYSPDGKYVYFVELPEGTRSVLWRVPAQGGDPEKLWSPGNRVEIYDISPDGNQVAFSTRERTTEVRVIDNLVQELERLDNIH